MQEETEKLAPSDGESDTQFGRSVSISDDGDTVLVGAVRHDDGGRAYIFD